MSVTAIVPAAGRGDRMGSAVAKQFLPLGGKPILTRTLLVLAGAPEITDVLVVVDEQDQERCRREVLEPYGVGKVRDVLPGGEMRQDSVERGLAEVDEKVEFVLVHDGVRPLVTQAVITATVRAAAQHGAAVAAVPVRDTVKRVSQGAPVVDVTVEREGLWAVQTPQVFRRELIVEAYSRAREDGFTGSDDASLVEHSGHAVHIVEGAVENLKITTPGDLIMAEAILREQGR